MLTAFQSCIVLQYEERSGAGRRKEVLKSIEQEEEERSRTDNNLAIEIARQLQGAYKSSETLRSVSFFSELQR